MPLALPLLPDLGRAAAFDHQRHLLVEMTLCVERAGAGNLDHIGAPQPLGAIELDIAAAPAEPLPGRQRQILHPPHPDAAIDWHPLLLHEHVIRHRLALEGAKARVLSRLGLMPMGCVRGVMHAETSSAGDQPFLFSDRIFLMCSSRSGGASAIPLMACSTSAPSIGLTSILSRMASSRYCGSLWTARKAASSALARSGGKPGGAA